MQMGMLGGGQLGRMAACAAASLGVKTHILAPESNPVAASVAHHIRGAYTDHQALDELIRHLGPRPCVTLEFENIPVKALAYLAHYVDLRPGIKALEIAQDRRLEKQFFTKTLGLNTARFNIINNEHDAQNVVIPDWPAILKTARDGYDGKGQVRISSQSELLPAWRQLGQVPLVLEQFVNFDQELSVILARDVHGHNEVFGPFVNEHEHHILATTWSGRPLQPQVEQEARDIAVAVGEALDYVGVLCLELFQSGDRLIVNEMAPRPHNSGHLTIEGYTVSQFEQQVRAVLGFPVAPTDIRQPAVMINLVGFQPTLALLQKLLKVRGLHWHWYSKDKVLPGRKVGHITLEAECYDLLLEKYAYVQELLRQNSQE